MIVRFLLFNLLLSAFTVQSLFSVLVVHLLSLYQVHE